MRGPDFFIVGAPKCGTTAMTDYLGQHPEIGMCARKETHYLAGDEMWHRFGLGTGERLLSREQYLNLFAGVQGCRRLGEASVWYLYSAAAAREIQRFSPTAQVIVMLRNPLEMLPSLHSQLVFVGLEPVTDFACALALDAERERAGTPPGFPPRSYRAAASYAEQLRRYLDVFGAERVHVITYDDFRDDTAGVYRGACAFLGVEPGFVPDIRVINPNKRVKSPALRRLVRTPSPRLRRAVHVASSQGLRRRAGDALNRWNTRFAQRPPISVELADSLGGLVAREVDELRTMLGVDLSSWLEQLGQAKPGA